MDFCFFDYLFKFILQLTILKYRFDKEICRKLLEIKWWDWEDNKIKKEIDNLYNIDKFINSLEIS